MTDQFSDLLRQLRRTTSYDVAPKAAQAIFFQLCFDEIGAFIRVVNKKGEEVDADYRSYSGTDRTLLKTLATIQERSGFVIDWDKPAKAADHPYLAEHDFLVWQLRGLSNLLDADMRPVSFPAASEGQAATILLEIRADHTSPSASNASARESDNNALAENTAQAQNGNGSQRMRARVLVVLEGEEYDSIRLLTEHSAIIYRTPSENSSVALAEIVEIAPLGEAFMVLPRFATMLLRQDVERYLSLLHSYFPSLRFRFEDFRRATDAPEAIKTAPALLFEKVDEDNMLYLRVAATLPQYPQFDSDFLAEYDITKIVSLNELERTFAVSNISNDGFIMHVEEIDKLLAKYAAKLTGKSVRKGQEHYIREQNTFIIPSDLAKEFIRHELKELIGSYTILGADKLKSYKVRAVQPSLNLRLSSGINFLEGDASLDIEGETFSLFDALSQYRKNSYITLADGTQAIINEQYLAKLERIFTKQKDKVKISFFDLPLVEDFIDETIAASAFQASRAIFQGFNDLATQKTKLPKINAILRPYQEQGYKWLQYLYDTDLGGCLADDMGLGKTLQAITLLSAIYPKEKRPTLVVMPKSLLFNWEAELQKFNPKLTYYTYYAANRDIKQARGSQLILTTYAMLRNDIEIFKEEKFHAVILDESQNIKNLQSQTSKAVMLLNADKRLALSGTPIENNLGELYALFRFLNPAMFGSAEEFNQRYATPIQRYSDKEAISDLRKKIYPFILRRLKKDVLTELPGKIEQTLLVDMSAEQAELYESRRRFYYDTVRTQVRTHGVQKSQFMILQALSELRQIASIPESQTDGAIISPKREVLMEQLSDVISNGRKALVFANFLAGVEAITEECENAGIRAQSMTGATSDRRTLVNTFQNDPDMRVFIMTLKTGGLGLNLTAADTIFILDPWWNIAAETQAIDRAHRMGQKGTVFAYKLVARGTIEEKILQLQEKKRALFDSVISSDTASLKALNDEDIEFMLGDAL
jgi:SNF2 family DNA or RNA helicase